MDTEKSINLFKMEKTDRLPDYISSNYFVYWFFNNFSELILYKINVVDFGWFFFKFFVISRNTKFLVKWKYWLEFYVPYILKWNFLFFCIQLIFFLFWTYNFRKKFNAITTKIWVPWPRKFFNFIKSCYKII